MISDKKGSAILHGNKFVFLTEWFSTTSSRDVIIVSLLFLCLCGSKRKHNFLTCTGNLNIPELHVAPGAHMSSPMRIYTWFTAHILQDLEIAFDLQKQLF